LPKSWKDCRNHTLRNAWGQRRLFTHFFPTKEQFWPLGRAFSAPAAFAEGKRWASTSIRCSSSRLIYVEAMLGLLLLFAWIQNANIHAVAW
jgi:hypothetical protein